MSQHTLHVTEWDSCQWAPTLMLECHAKAGDPCHTETDEMGENPKPIDHCNAVEWFDAVDGGADLIHGRLPGAPPWRVDVEWTDDGPHIVRASDPSQQVPQP